MSGDLLALPNELVIAILRSLPLADLVRCQAVCQKLRGLIQGSSELQYLTVLKKAGYEDVPSSLASIPNKRENLERAQSSWKHLSSRFTKEVKVQFTQSGIYDLTSGTYILGEETKHTLYHIALPEREDDQPEWKSFSLRETIIDLGLCIDEHDLVAVITYVPICEDDDVCFGIEMHLLQFSTGEPHPEAQQHRILVRKDPSPAPAIGIEIVGDNLVLILTHHRSRQRPDDHVFVYEWKTGKLKMSMAAPYLSYSGPLFLTEHQFILSNTKSGTLEVWDIPRTTTEPGPSAPRCELALPPLAPGKKYTSITSRGEPNPRGESSPAGSKTRNASYQADSNKAIVIFNVTIVPTNAPFAGIAHTYSFFVHRGSIIKTIQDVDNHPELYRPKSRAISPFEPPKLPLASPPIDIHFPGSSTRLDTQESLNTHITVPWDKWGPKNTRWFEVDSLPTRWITTTAGQRAVLTVPRQHGGTTIMVFDFNEWAIKRALYEKDQKEAKGAAEKQLEKSEVEGTPEDKGKAVARDESAAPFPVTSSEPYGGLFNAIAMSHINPDNVGANTEATQSNASASTSEIQDIVMSDDEDSDWEDEGEDGITESTVEEGTGNANGDAGIMLPSDIDATTAPLQLLQHLYASNPHLMPLFLTAMTPGGPSIHQLLMQPGVIGPPNPAAAHEDEDSELEDEFQIDIDGEEEDGEDEFSQAAEGPVVFTEVNQVDKFGRSFESPIESELPFVRYVSKRQATYEGVLMDEERILGMVANDLNDSIRRIDIHYFG
ncbi:hypothetical protein FA15DRAFT_582146 [Coprinopsis marcescibilis]|uniref:F-box domain-containing protein n=1 Tax=Coprinopsis marcescibilis TaxID=230819 RepID=A0A5C3LAN8_COPMA|nr:hypothetical protein FA15DRAFT_582146 [Coprinopsis marcescibilis]